jgi:hypothetical protein
MNKKQATLTRVSSSLLLIAAVTLLSGCGNDGPKTVPVTGKITLNGGPWPERGMIVFAPKEAAEGYPRRAGQAIFDRNGDYSATTFASHDGLIPGAYSVNLRCITQVNGDVRKAVNHVPPNYQRGERSGFEVIVPADDSSVLVFDFDVPTKPL